MWGYLLAPRSSGDDFIPTGDVTIYGDKFGDHNWGLLLATREWRPERLLNILMHRTAPHNKELPEVSTAPSLRNYLTKGCPDVPNNA